MLLGCCFRQPSKKKHKKNKFWKNEKVRDSEESNELSKGLVSTPTILSPITKHADNPELPADYRDSDLCQERGPSHEKELKLNKIQEQSFPTKLASPQTINACTPYSEGSKAQINSQSVTNVSAIQCEKQQHLVPKDVSRMFASAEDLEGSNTSFSNTHQSCKRSIQSIYSQPLSKSKDHDVSSYDSGEFSQKLNKTTQRNLIVEEEKSNDRSMILQEEPLIQTQIRNNETASREEEMKCFLGKIREETEKRIEALKIQHMMELEKVKESIDVKELAQKETHRKDLEKANNTAKKAANETISQLNKQIVFEREKLFAEQQENSKHLDKEFRMKEDRLNQSLKEVEEREQTWRDESAEVLKEVQRLKAEATRMVKILAMEYEEDNLSEHKKISLSQEVYSLQLVVEMRTGEVRNLREQLARATQELEQVEPVKEKLRKATTRMEDLEEQIKIKTQLEKKLSVEKVQLEMNVTNTSKEVDRMSKNVESLQWRIRNNFDLPVDSLTPVPSEENQRTSLPAFFDDHEKRGTDYKTGYPQSAPVTGKKFEFNQRISSSFLVGDEMIKASTTNTKVIDKVVDQYVKRKMPLCSDELNHKITDEDYVSNSPEFKHKGSDSEVYENNDQQVINMYEDVDSLDEGVGDISSDGEHRYSPQFDESNKNTNNNNKVGEHEIMKIIKKDEKVSDLTIAINSDLHSNKQRLNSSTTSPVNERIPSRF